MTKLLNASAAAASDACILSCTGRGFEIAKVGWWRVTAVYSVLEKSMSELEWFLKPLLSAGKPTLFDVSRSCLSDTSFSWVHRLYSAVSSKRDIRLRLPFYFSVQKEKSFCLHWRCIRSWLETECLNWLPLRNEWALKTTFQTLMSPLSAVQSTFC